MSEKAKSILYYLSVLFMCGVGFFSLIRSAQIKEQSINLADKVVNRSLYLNLSDDVNESVKIINTIKDDYYFKGKDTGYWKMETNEYRATEDNVFIVNIVSYPGDNKSEEYANRFANYLKTWFKFKELEDDWTDRSDQLE